MPFIFVVVRRPARDNPAEIMDWGAFKAIAKLEHLKGLAGVFCIDEAAWIFDTRTALPQYGRVVHVADQLKIQLHVFPLDAEAARSHGASYPQSKKLAEFLAS